MKYLHISYSDNAGGAAKAAYRLHKGLKSMGKESIFYTINKSSKNSIRIPSGLFCFKPIIKRVLDRVLFKISSKFGDNLISFIVGDKKALRFLIRISKKDDIFILHTPTFGLLSLKDILYLCKVRNVIWRLPDYRILNNGLPYPRVQTSGLKHLERLTKDFFDGLNSSNLVFVSPSKSLMEFAKSKFPNINIIQILTGVDYKKFAPLQQNTKNLERKKFLFSAINFTSSKFKGWPFLREFIENYNLEKDICLGVVGDSSEVIVKNPRLSFMNHGKLESDHEIVSLYQSYDFIVVPSLDDNLPNSALEAMSCGLPLISTKVGGLSILSQSLDYKLAFEYGDFVELKRIFDYCIGINDMEYKRISKLTRQYIKDKFSFRGMLSSYVKIDFDARCNH